VKCEFVIIIYYLFEFSSDKWLTLAKECCAFSNYHEMKINTAEKYSRLSFDQRRRHAFDQVFCL
jgi:hypothetical protein